MRFLVLLSLLAFVDRCTAEVPTGQKNILTAIYNSCGGTSWTNRWNTGSTVCPSGALSWFGVVCNTAANSVIELNLGYNNLAGGAGCCTALSGLSGLTNLRYLFLSNNAIACQFPAGLASLTSLQTLHIHNNLFSGSLPTMTGMTSFQSLIAFNNRLTGPIPQFPTSLKKLYLTKNLIASTIPTSVSTLTNLQALFLGNNSIPGPLPNSFQGLTSLLFIDLSNNQIDGSLIGRWSAQGSTRPTVYLRNNALDCILPTTLATTSHELDLSLNRKPFLCPLPAIAPSVIGVPGCVTMTLASITPPTVFLAGGTVTLYGTNFNQCAGLLTVRIGSSYAAPTITQFNSTLWQMTFTAPAQTTAGYRAVQVYMTGSTPVPVSSNALGVTYQIACIAACNPALNANVSQCDFTTGRCICKTGWGGPDCRTVFIPCPSNCNNAGSCNNGTGVCTCNPTYTGPSCSIRDFDCPDNCFNSRGNGVCNRETGFCSCVLPFLPPNCLQQPCPSDCNGHGTCNTTSGVCLCDQFWSGVACTEPNLPCGGTPECNGRGSCDSFTGLCSCTGTFTTASDCEFQPCPNGCTSPSKGTCNGVTGVCTCTATWTGPDCNTPNFPCGGTPECGGPAQGICNRANGVCICNGDYSVISNCTVRPCPRDCYVSLGHGTCVGSTGNCSCNAGWAGLDCGTRNLTCGGTPECTGRGTCNRLAGVCSCNPPFTSASNCSVQPCPADCFGSHGVCNGASGVCTCNTGWTGVDCSIPDIACTPADCNAQGTCNRLTGQCICDPGYDAATQCATRPCPGRGDCNAPDGGTCNQATGVCSCNPTYTGADCLQRNIPCAVPSCSGQGTCDVTRGVCVCNPGYDYTTDCATRTCSANCNNRGTCNTATGICNCDDPTWTGPACEIRNLPCGTNVTGQVCSGRGTCDSGTGTCRCDSVPSGEQPWLPDAPSFCGWRNCPGTCYYGVCNTTIGVCECDSNYFGVLCQTPDNCCDDCVPGNRELWCNKPAGGGLCRPLDGQCVCNQGYSLASNCSTCAEGYVPLDTANGTVCQRALECAATCLSPRGTCDPYTGVCTCSEDYTGANCDEFVCPLGEYCDKQTGDCSMVACSNHGVCIDVNTCQCIKGYKGEACETVPSHKGDAAGAAIGAVVAVLVVSGGALYYARRRAIKKYYERMGKAKEMK